jgi:CBS domain-containing protein
MAFYLVNRGNVRPYEFKYLHPLKLDIRLEKTQISGVPKKPSPKSEQEKTTVYAIDLMSKTILSLSPAAKVEDARNLMQQKRIRHVPIIVDNKLTGMISSVDIRHLDESSEADNTKRLHTIMEQVILCASESTALVHILQVFTQEDIRCLPIVNEHLQMTGILTVKDVLRWFLKEKKYLEN